MLDALNAISHGWTEGPSGLLCNPNAGGGIIDSAIATGAWFVVFNDDRETIEGLATREDAIRAFKNATKVHVA